MVTRVNPLMSSGTFEVRIIADPRTQAVTVKTNRPLPTIQVLGMALDAATILFKSFCEQQSGIVGSGIKVEETTTEPQPTPPEKVV